jgi:hypothetical protein
MYLKYRQKLLLGITLIIVACIVGASTLIYLGFFEEEETIEPELTEQVLYDLNAISPYVNQALILEISRIRHRGLCDTIMQRGGSWKNKPMFYFISNIDDQEYVSKDVAAAGGAATETFFTTWDTMFQENKIVRNAEEEQETSSITLTILEHKTIGLLGLRSQNEEKEKISLTYDYRTGRWEGDDFFDDSDGYGHYVGETFEVWFNLYQTDYDHDYIPYWTEVNVLNTNPKVDDSNLDPDSDGIPTTWEWRWGYDPHTYDNHTVLDPDRDGLENVEEYQMEKWFANPYSQDIYIEADGMEKGKLIDITHVFWEESQQILIERFARHGVNAYVDAGWPDTPNNGGGEILPFYETLSQDSGMMNQFYTHHFPDERKGIFRYLVIGNNAGFCHPSEFNRYDTMAVGTSLKKLYINRKAWTPRTQRLALAAGVMHELGHSLGIGPWNVGGNDNISFAESREAKQQFLEEWGDYKSVMSYYYIWDYNIVDYSDGSHGPNDVNDWALFDLTAFQNETRVVEDPGFELPGYEEVGLIRYMAIRSKIEV